jgi:hypothetical protein
MIMRSQPRVSRPVVALGHLRGGRLGAYLIVLVLDENGVFW